MYKSRKWSEEQRTKGRFICVNMCEWKKTKRANCLHVRNDQERLGKIDIPQGKGREEERKRERERVQRK